MTELTDERLAELRKIAEETRPGGGWTADGYQVTDEDGHQVYGADAYGDGTSPAAEHIAAFDPPTVLALLAEVERLRGQLDNPRDEYHTMDELYHYRMLYNAMCANLFASHGGDVHKSWRHADGKLCFGGGWFIVTMQLPTGQVSSHYSAEHWDAFRAPERERAAAWDGHTPDMAAERMERYVRDDA